MKKILRFSLLKNVLIAAFSLLLALMMTATTFASSVSGTYTVADNGQGGWTGGLLYADGTLGGGGALSFDNGQEIAKITGGTWSSVSSSAVELCFNRQPIKDPLGILSGTACFGPIAADGQPHKITSPDGGITLVRVSLH